jgi:hypothetical protein
VEGGGCKRRACGGCEAARQARPWLGRRQWPARLLALSIVSCYMPVLLVLLLRLLLQARGAAAAAGDCLEKRELVDCLAEGGNSTDAACSICCEDYQPGGAARKQGPSLPARLSPALPLC